MKCDHRNQTIVEEESSDLSCTKIYWDGQFFFCLLAATIQHYFQNYYDFVGCTNQFVRVEYDPAASTITCVFLNAESQNSSYTCSISYGPCLQEMNQAAQGSTTMEFPDRVTVPIELSGSDCYMYLVKATNGTFTVTVERNINTGPRGKFE